MSDLRGFQIQPMIGVVLRVLRALALLTLAFALMIVVIVTQPHDDSAIRSFFIAPQDCASPCFMGIRPGVTHSDQAEALLRANPWIDQVSSSTKAIQWTWNGQQPAFLRGDPSANQISLNDGLVNSIEIGTGMDMATIQLAFGSPDMWLSFNSMLTSTQTRFAPLISFKQHALYGAYDFEVSTEGVCPQAINGQWTLLARISMPLQSEYPGFTASTRAIPPLPKDCT